MFSFFCSLLNSIFKILFTKKKNVIFTMMLLKKENEAYRRNLNLQNRRLNFWKNDKLSFAMIKALSMKAINHLAIVKPETVLSWQRRFIKNFWSYKHKPPGRKPVSNDIKKLILEMKQENYLWGCKKIADELKKINIEIHYTTVNRIISSFRKQGLIKPNGSWKRFYLLIILELKTRKIVRFDLTENPCRKFVKQRIELFSEDFEEKKTLIFDNALQFTSIDYSWYDIKGVNICTSAPNMNAYIERLNGTIRREALDHFLIFSEKQVRKIISEFVEYYNNQRMHQGINKIPDAEIDDIPGTIKKTQVLSGLHHLYYRSSA